MVRSKNSFIKDGDYITFSCSKEDFTDIITGDVYVSGTFCYWAPFNEDGDISLYKMVQSGGAYSLKKNIKELIVPGNTGFAEYAFYTYDNSVPKFLHEKEGAFSNFLLDNHILIIDDNALYNDAALSRFYGIKSFKAVKTLEDFDLKSVSDVATMANFRQAAGAKNLFRGYHPYKKSKTIFGTDDERVKAVNALLKKHDVKSIITLCGDEEPDGTLGEEKSDYVLEIERALNHFFIDIDYNLVYYHSDSDEFLEALRVIMAFIVKGRPPYYIHCRLGSDRTGVICAVLSLLCGASWDEVALDYERTRDMGVGEYRDRRLLLHSIKKMSIFKESDDGSFLYTGVLGDCHDVIAKLK